ncbi:hypothetical protein ABMA27_016067 [Loxostege sticticalis]|uniref:Uncharacterized protein n=1 Tax=Loxostege sticticalis TaxID=481309 RepID=A0ABR3I5F5_LOXSC
MSKIVYFLLIVTLATLITARPADDKKPDDAAKDAAKAAKDAGDKAKAGADDAAKKPEDALKVIKLKLRNFMDLLLRLVMFYIRRIKGGHGNIFPDIKQIVFVQNNVF